MYITVYISVCLESAYNAMTLHTTWWTNPSSHIHSISLPWSYQGGQSWHLWPSSYRLSCRVFVTGVCFVTPPCFFALLGFLPCWRFTFTRNAGVRACVWRLTSRVNKELSGSDPRVYRIVPGQIALGTIPTITIFSYRCSVPPSLPRRIIAGERYLKIIVIVTVAVWPRLQRWRCRC